MIKIYGSSDDLIEVEGDINEEFEYTSHINPMYIATSNGVLLKIRYDGEWIIRVVVDVTNPAYATKVKHAPNPECEYSDVATIQGAVRWVLVGNNVQLYSKMTDKIF